MRFDDVRDAAIAAGSLIDLGVHADSGVVYSITIYGPDES